MSIDLLAWAEYNLSSWGSTLREYTLSGTPLFFFAIFRCLLCLNKWELSFMGET